MADTSSDMFEFIDGTDEETEEDYRFLEKSLECFASDSFEISEHAFRELSKRVFRINVAEYIRNSLFRSSFESGISFLPVVFRYQTQRVRLFRRLVSRFPEIISDHLIINDHKKRLKMVTVCTSIFKFAVELNYPLLFTAVADSQLLFKRLIARHQDGCEDVRFAWIHMSEVVMTAVFPVNGLHDGFVMAFKNMLKTDPSAEVRMEAVCTLDRILVDESSILLQDEELHRILMHRVGDKVREIRIKSISVMAKLYHLLIQFKPNHPDRYKLISSIFVAYKSCWDGKLSMEEKCAIETALYQRLFHAHPNDAHQRAKDIFTAFLMCKNVAVSAFGQILADAKNMRLMFLNALLAKQGNDMKRLVQHVKELSYHFDWYKDANHIFLALVDQLDSDLLNKLLYLFADPPDITADQTAIIMSQFTDLTDGTPYEELHYDFLIRSGSVLNDTHVHTHLMHLIDEHITDTCGLDVVRCASLLTFWINIFDRYFDQYEVQEHLSSILQRHASCFEILHMHKEILRLPDSFWQYLIDLQSSLLSPAQSTAPLESPEPVSPGSMSPPIVA